jgi:FHS family Na+ dependent glucose MFS transporter 1
MTAAPHPLTRILREAGPATAAYYAAFVVFGLANALIGPMLPFLALSSGTSLAAIGVLFPARALGYLLGALALGRLYDRRPGHPLMALVLGGIAAALFILPLASWLPLMALAAAVLGAGEGALDVGANSLISWIHAGRLGPYMNALHFFFGVGALLAPLAAAGAAASPGGEALAFYLLAGLTLLPLAWIARLPSPARPGGAGAPPAGRPDWPWVLLTCLLLFLYVGVEVGFGGWVFSYAQARAVPAPAAALLTSLFWAVFTIGRLAAIPLSARFSPQAILSADLGLAALALAGILLFPAGAVAQAALWAGAALLGLALASIFPSALTLAERRMTLTGQVNSLIFMAVGAGGMVLPGLMGSLLQAAGPQAVMLALLGAVLLAAAVLAGMLARLRRPPIPR